MIIVRLMGGLGNQMFQYAAGKRLALVRGVDLKLDLGLFERFPDRSYELDAFQVENTIASRGEIRRLRYGGMPQWKLLTNGARRRAKESSPSFIKEKHFHFDESILCLGEEAYLDGYWQSERYFSDISHEIREIFSVRDLPEKVQHMAHRISSCQSVSMHVRRGDYVQDDRASDIFQSIPIHYYERGANYFRQLLGQFEIFLFSDDLSWVRENISMEYRITFVEGFSAVEDMLLMSMCRHNIIANSSFSWWAGWLNKHNDKTVVAPSNWFRTDDLDTRDLIPEGWKII